MNNEKIMKKRIIYLILVVFLLLILLVQITVGFPLVLVRSELSTKLIILDTLKIGDVIEPIKDFHFSDANCSAYLMISKNDFNKLPSAIKKKKLFKISDHNILKKLQSEFKFKYTEGDVATCESMIYFFNNDKLIFKSAIVIEKDRVGLQNQYGWIEALEANKLIVLFEKWNIVYSPIVVL